MASLIGTNKYETVEDMLKNVFEYQLNFMVTMTLIMLSSL